MKRIFIGLMALLLLWTGMARAEELNAPQIGIAVCAPEGESDTVALYAEPDEESDAAFNYYSGVVVEVTELTGEWARVRVGDEKAALEGWMRTNELAYGAEKEREVPHVVLLADRQQLTVYAAPDSDAEVLRQTDQHEAIDVIGIGQNGWMQLDWSIGKNVASDDKTGFVRLRKGTKWGKPRSLEIYFVHPVEGEISFEEAEMRARNYVKRHEPLKVSPAGMREWIQMMRAIDSESALVTERYISEKGETQFEVWLYHEGNEDIGTAVTLTPNGEVISAGEGWG